MALHFICRRADAKSWPVYRTIIHFAVDKASLDQRHPWKTSGSRSSTGTGFYIGQRRIITNCHVIKDATSIRLTRNGQPGAFKGIVLCQSEMCDLALVTVENESFWTNMPTVEFESETPVLGDQVIAVGYPLGAKSVTITRGVVSAVSLADLSLMHRNPRLMRIQIDAAINPGNSGVRQRVVLASAIANWSVRSACFSFSIPCRRSGAESRDAQNCWRRLFVDSLGAVHVVHYLKRRSAPVSAPLRE